MSLLARRYDDQHLLSIFAMLSGPIMSERGWQEKLLFTDSDITSEAWAKN